MKPNLKMKKWGLFGSFLLLASGFAWILQINLCFFLSPIILAIFIIFYIKRKEISTQNHRNHQFHSYSEKSQGDYNEWLVKE